jgi:SAM-dependent methyltransferase
MAFQDHFSKQAADYARFRPRYPEALFDWLAEAAPSRRRAWDAGAGNGQAALALADRFDEVIGTDPSREQLERTPPHARLRPIVAGERCAAIDADSVDLVTVAQAAHWFDLGSFSDEVRRVARDGAVVALWCYGLFRIAPAIDAVMDSFYVDRVGGDWPPERRLVDEGYRSLPFPFAPLEAPAFVMETHVTVAGLVAYVGTWSAVMRHRERTGIDPLPGLREELAPLVGADEVLTLRFPLGLRVGRVVRGGIAG